MPAHRKNYDDAQYMYERGLSIQHIAHAFGISRQAMYMILRRRGVTFRPHLRYADENHFYRGGTTPKAQFIVIEAVRKGILVVKPCEACGLPPLTLDGRQRIQGHHEDYNHLLQVTWLCQPCHHAWHVHSRPIPRTVETIKCSREIFAALGGKASAQLLTPEEHATRMGQVRAGRKPRAKLL